MRAEDEPRRTRRASTPTCETQECQRARGQAVALTQDSQVVFYTTNPKGERVAMDDAARLAERQRLDYWIRQNCQNNPSK